MPPSSRNGQDSDAVQFTFSVVDRAVAGQMAPMMIKLEKLELEVADLKREVHDGNSRSITAPGKSIVITMNGYWYAVVVTVALAIILGLVGQAAILPAVLKNLPAPAPTAMPGE